jgi:hypothetical protein
VEVTIDRVTGTVYERFAETGILDDTPRRLINLVPGNLAPLGRCTLNHSDGGISGVAHSLPDPGDTLWDTSARKRDPGLVGKYRGPSTAGPEVQQYDIPGPQCPIVTRMWLVVRLRGVGTEGHNGKRIEDQPTGLYGLDDHRLQL